MQKDREREGGKIERGGRQVCGDLRKHGRQAREQCAQDQSGRQSACADGERERIVATHTLPVDGAC